MYPSSVICYAFSSKSVCFGIGHATYTCLEDTTTLAVMTIPTISVASLKAVKNSVIGNRTAKGNYGRDEAFVAKYVVPRRMACPRTEYA